MQRHAPADLRRFLLAVDEALGRHAELLVIGGAAAALHYGAQRHTSDIDTFRVVPPEVQKAVDTARSVTKLDVPVSFAAIADAPYDFEDRLEQVNELPLRKLQIVVPERHDLALMKVIRGYEHDLQVIREMHDYRRLELETLVGRFTKEMSHVIADARKVRLNFLLLVERLYASQSRRAAGGSSIASIRCTNAVLNLPGFEGSVATWTRLRLGQRGTGSWAGAVWRAGIVSGPNSAAS